MRKHPTTSKRCILRARKTRNAKCVWKTGSPFKSRPLAESPLAPLFFDFLKVLTGRAWKIDFFSSRFLSIRLSVFRALSSRVNCQIAWNWKKYCIFPPENSSNFRIWLWFLLTLHFIGDRQASQRSPLPFSSCNPLKWIWPCLSGHKNNQ